jgi:hypothetical protein
VVILTCDPATFGFWLTRDYFPEFVERDRETMPTLEELSQWFDRVEVFPVAIPHDCVDGFLGAYWRRPSAYLQEDVRRGISSFAMAKDLSALTRLQDDVESGRWAERNHSIVQRDELDVGYRLVVGHPAAGR